MVGELIAGRYEIVARLGSGGTSSVWRVRDRLDGGRPRAVKLLHVSRAASPEAVARFEREARTLEGLDSPNVVRIHDHGEHDGRPFIVLDLIEGEDLRRRLARESPLPPAEAVAVAEQVAAGLAAAHARRVVHRDLKPANVLLVPDGRVQLVDFGISRVLEEPGLTQPGRTVGTGDYVSPEQALGRPVDERSDVYALGVLLFEMLAGRPPFTGGGFADVAAMHVQATPPTLAAVVPETPQPLVALVARCLAKDPDDRPQQVELVRAELRAILATLGGGEADTGEIPVVQAALEDSPIVETQVLAAASLGDRAGLVRSGAEPTLPVDGATLAPWELDPGSPAAAFAVDHVDDGPTGHDHTPLAALPSAREHAGPLRWVALAALALALVVGGVVWARARDGGADDEAAAPRTSTASTAAGAGTTPTASTPAAGAGRPLDVAAAAAFDPQGDAEENDAAIPRVLDGDPGTVWSSEVYRNTPDLTGVKPGLGLSLDLGSLRRVRGLRVQTPRPGFTAAVYTATGATAPDDLSDWRQAAPPRVVANQTATLTLRRPQQARYVLLWFTRLSPTLEGNGYSVKVGEARPVG